MTVDVTFWARYAFAESQIIEALQTVEGTRLRVVRDSQEAMGAVDDTDFFVLVDAPAEEARAFMARVSSGTGRLAAMHFNSAGIEGFSSAGMPDAIRITQVKGALAPGIAEHVFALLLGLTRNLPASLAAQGRNSWSAPEQESLSELRGKTMLLVGLGHIGRSVARLAKAFDMRVLVANRTARDESGIDEIFGLQRLEECLPGADVVVLSIALTPDTRHIIDRRRLDLMRETALLVNVGRGGLVDTNALADALIGGHLGGAGIDVAEPEPLAPDHLLWQAPNLIVTAHCSGISESGARRIAGQARESLVAWLAERQGQKP